LGFEAASRNAAHVTLLEFSRPALLELKQNRDKLKVEHMDIVQADALVWLRTCQQRFDLIFLDPPFSSSLMESALPLAGALLKPEGWLYVEQSSPLHAPDGFIIYREGCAGLSHFGLLKRI
jgi:16S rRNA (guanine966-N2)-methyltransferase